MNLYTAQDLVLDLQEGQLNISQGSKQLQVSADALEGLKEALEGSGQEVGGGLFVSVEWGKVVFSPSGEIAQVIIANFSEKILEAVYSANSERSAAKNFRTPTEV